jgi:hypothetical protein
LLLRGFAAAAAAAAAWYVVCVVCWFIFQLQVHQVKQAEAGCLCGLQQQHSNGSAGLKGQ